MTTRKRILSELHDHLVSKGYNIVSLRQKDEDDPSTISVVWAEGVTPDPNIQTEIDSYTWDYEYESDKERLIRLETELEQLKRSR